MVLTPIAVGVTFRIFITPQDKLIAAEAVAGLLMVGTIAGILMALFLNNGGGAWDNAKKYIESGAHGGKYLTAAGRDEDEEPDARGGGRRRHGRRPVQGHGRARRSTSSSSCSRRSPWCWRRSSSRAAAPRGAEAGRRSGVGGGAAAGPGKGPGAAAPRCGPREVMQANDTAPVPGAWLDGGGGKEAAARPPGRGPAPPSAGGEPESDAQRALFQRPRISVATRMTAALAALFLLVSAVTVTAVVLLRNLKVRQGFLERAASYELEVQQARRYEKNFFLYGTNLDDALSSIHMADAYLERSTPELESMLGVRKLARMRGNLVAYERSLERLLQLSQAAAPVSAEERLDVQRLLRGHGAQIVVDAQEALDQERLAVHAAFNVAMVSAVGFLVLMVVTMTLVGVFLARTVLSPLGRFMRYMERIGTGDYSPITPVRRYRDEFSSLAMAINRTLHDLKAHQERLVHSERMAAVGSLTSGIAHELNNPLNNIGLTTEALVSEFRELSDDEKLQMLDQISTQVERASATVRQLLDFTRKDQPAFSRLAVGPLLESTLKLIGNELTLARVEARLQVGEELPELLGSPRNLQQVFLNLCLNAIQAMPSGGVLDVQARQDGPASIRVDVGDTGVGIEAENLSRIFEPFFTTKEVGKGTGLGLTLVQSIVEKHGGHVTVRSAVGEGTTFSVVLPVATSRGKEDRTGA